MHVIDVHRSYSYVGEPLAPRLRMHCTRFLLTSLAQRCGASSISGTRILYRLRARVVGRRSCLLSWDIGIRLSRHGTYMPRVPRRYHPIGTTHVRHACEHYIHIYIVYLRVTCNHLRHLILCS